MKEEVTLKLFGTGQITIPKKWRDFLKTDTFKAVFDPIGHNISVKPITLVELEDTRWIAAKRLQQDLNDTDYSEAFQKELLASYQKSDFYKSGLQKSKK